MTSAPHGILLDTSVVIKPPASGLPAPPGGIAVSVVTIAELHFGVGNAADPLEQQFRRSRVQRIINSLDVITLDPPIAEVYGVLTSTVRLAGRNPRPRRFDLLIAATAIHHGLALATRNADDFRHLERALAVIGVKD